MDAQQLRHWFVTAIGHGRAAQPTDSGIFPSSASLVAEEELPPSLREARDFYQKGCFDWGGAWVHRQRIGEAEVLFVHVGTDGDEGWLEVFDGRGRFLEAAFIDGNRVFWEPRETARSRVAGHGELE